MHAAVMNAVAIGCELEYAMAVNAGFVAGTVPDFVPPLWTEELDNRALAAAAFRAAQHLDENGWCQGVWVDGAGRTCALGVVIHTAPTATAKALEQEALVHIGPEYDYVPEWNDAPERTKEDVINLWLTVAAVFEGRAAVLASQ